MKCRDMLQSGRLEKRNLETAREEIRKLQGKADKGYGESFEQNKSAGNELDILAAIQKAEPDRTYPFYNLTGFTDRDCR